MNCITLKGFAAIEYAAKNNLTLGKYADPIEEARENVSLDEASAIAIESDPNLIYLRIDSEERSKPMKKYNAYVTAADNGGYQIDYPALTAALRENGATEQEAESLTDILDLEGWGGDEFAQNLDAHLFAKIEWYRGCRAGATK